MDQMDQLNQMDQMDQIKSPRKVCIVRYGNKLLSLQLHALAAALIVLAVAMSTGWVTLILALAFLMLVASGIFQVVRIRKAGLTVWVRDLDDEEAADKTAESPIEEPLDEQIDHPAPPAEPGGEQEEPHWTEVAYPDPDIELLAEPPEEQPSQQTENTSA